MTVNNTARRVPYTGNGTTKAFAVPFQFFALEVYVDGVLTPANQYTVTQSSAGATGTVTFNAAPANSKSVVIFGATTPTQQTDYADNDDFAAETAEQAFDRLTMLAQEAQLADSYAFRMPKAKGAPIPELDTTLGSTGVVALVSGVPTLQSADQFVSGAISQATGAATAAAASATAAAASATAASGSANTAQTAVSTVNSLIQGLSGGATIDRFDSRAAAALTSIQAGTLFINTAGRYTKGDGGEGLYFKRGSTPSPSNTAVHFQSVDGAWWELVAGPLNAKQAGAKGDNSTNDATAITAMMTSGRTELIFPEGVYKVGSQITATAANLIVRGTGLARIVADQSVSIGSVLKFEGDNCTVRDLTIEAAQWSAFGDTILTDTCLRFANSNTGLAYTGAKVFNVTCLGANKGIVINGGKQCAVDGAFVDKAYQYGIVVQYGLQDSVLTNFTIRRVGITDALKFGFGGTIQPVRNVTVSNFYIEDCGVLDTVRGNWQNGIDLYCAVVQGVKITNGHIKDCGGAIECKTNGQNTVTPDTYEMLDIDGVHMESKWGNKYGIFMAWASVSSGETDPTATAPNKIGKATVQNCTMRTVLAGGEVADSNNVFVEIDGWTDVQVRNCHAYGVNRFARLTGMGSTDATVRRITVQGCSTSGSQAKSGVIFAGGAAEDITIQDNWFSCDKPIGFEGAAGTGFAGDTGVVTNAQIRRNRLTCTATTTNDFCLVMRNMRGIVYIDDNLMEAEYRNIGTIANAGSMTCTGYVRRNVFRARNAGSVNYAVDIREGTWNVNHNDASDIASANGRTVQVIGPGVVNAARNLRGTTNNAAPASKGGSLGDYYINHALPAAGIPEWYCTAVSDTAATWKGAAAIAA